MLLLFIIIKLLAGRPGDFPSIWTKKKKHMCLLSFFFPGQREQGNGPHNNHFH